MTTGGSDGATAHAQVEGREVRLTNLDKVLWPAVGMTKQDLIEYYVRVSSALLPHLADHPVTLHRFPDGVDGPHWYETRAPAHPAWVRTQEMYTFRSGKDVHAAVIDGLPELMWAANAASIELHPYLGTTADLRAPTVVVFDLDPGPPAGLVEAARVALALRSLLEDRGLSSYPKTSGSKGLHVYVPLNSAHTYERTKDFARAVASALAMSSPDEVVDVMPRAQRAGKVFIDWSQNDSGKSTIAPYSLRGLRYPTVSTPVRWSEIEAVHHTGTIDGLVLLAPDAIERIDEMGDLFEPVLTSIQSLPQDFEATPP